MGAKAGKKQHLTHVNAQGDVHMVAVDEKPKARRSATAVATISCSNDAIRALASAKKGDVLATVRIAAIQGAKRTAELIPLCHPIPLTHVTVDVALGPKGARITCRAEATDRTGVEMEAMTAASVGALTFYDMLKAVDRAMTFEIALLEKTGGKSGVFRAPANEARARAKRAASR